MSQRVLKFLLRFTRCEVADPMETYETTQPWVTYTYRYSDRALDWFGRSLIGCTCCICGAREDVEVRAPTAWFRKPPPSVDQGHHPLRRQFLAAHMHPGVNRNPVSWELPLRNPAALREGDMEDVFGVAIDRARRASPEPTGEAEP